MNKLNFQYCKKCYHSSGFLNYTDGLNFYCIHCKFFVFEVKNYEPEKFNFFVNVDQLTEEDFVKINKINIKMVGHFFLTARITLNIW